MKLIVPISTRGRPLLLAGALHSFTTLASGQHEIQYVIGVDDDDEATALMRPQLDQVFPVELVTRPRPDTLGRAWNSLVQHRAWDICVVAADKHLCLTPGWDDAIVRGLNDYKLPLANWHLLRAPEETVLILTRAWYEAIGEQVFPEYFPFWFSERWVVEVYELAYGKAFPKFGNLLLTEPELKTQGLRDLELWFEFFARTRPMRLAQAVDVANYFQRALPDLKPRLDAMAKVDAWQIPRIPDYYRLRGEAQGAPSPQYLAAKARAEKMLGILRLEQMEVAGAA